VAPALLRRLLLPSALAAAIALTAAIASASATAGERVRVALLPVVVHAADGHEYLQQGLADMLVSRLAREPHLAVIPIEDPKTATTDADAARKTAVANGADYVLFGSFTQFGEGASLDLACASVHDAKAEPRKVYVHAEKMGALIPLLDGVAERVSYAILDGRDPNGPKVASGPPGEGSAAADAEIADLRRRVDALERAVFDVGTTHGSAGSDTSAAGGAGRRSPGLPSDRDDGRFR
jgi:TolB-like protein